MKAHVIYGFFCLLSIVSFANVPDNSLKQGFIDRLDALNNISIIYNYHQSFTPTELDFKVAELLDSRIGKDVKMTAVAVSGHLKTENKASFLNKNFKIEKKYIEVPSSTPAGAAIAETEIEIYHPQRNTLERLTKIKDDYQGEIRTITQLWDLEIDTALGFRGSHLNNWLSKEEIGKMVVGQTEEGLPTLTYYFSETAFDEWTLDPNKNYAPVRHIIYQKPNNQEKAYVNVEMIMEDFKLIDKQYLPYKITTSVFSKQNEQLIKVRGSEITVSDYKLNDKTNTEAAYQMIWPNGTVVIDYINGRHFRSDGNHGSGNNTTHNSALEAGDTAAQNGWEQHNLQVPKLLVKTQFHGAAPLQEIVQLYDESSLPQFYEILQDENCSGYELRMAVLYIGLISQRGNEQTTKELLDFFKRSLNWDNYRHIEREIDNSVFAKFHALGWMGFIGESDVEEILKRAMTVDGVKELAKEWLRDIPSTTFSVVDNLRGHAALGLAFSDKQEVQTLIKDEYEKERKVCLDAGKTSGAYINLLTDAMARMDIVKDIGLEAHRKLYDGRGSYSNLYSVYIRKYLLFDAGPPVEIVF